MKRTVIKNKRINLKLSHGEVAQALGISRSFYTQIENGTRDPSLKVAQKIARFYDVSLDEIFLSTDVAKNNKLLA